MKEQCIYTKFAPERNDKFALQTSIVVCDGIKYVKKTAMYPEAEQHIKAMVENCNILTDIYGKDCVAQCIYSTSSEMYMEYVSGETLAVVLENLLSEKQYDEFYDLVNEYVIFIKKSCSDFCDLNNEYNFDFMSPNRITNIDFIFDNIIVRDDKFVIIDYEWLVTKIDYKYVLYRALNTFLVRKKYDIGHNILQRVEDEYELNECSTYKMLDEKIYYYVLNDLLHEYRKSITVFSDRCVQIDKPILFTSKTGEYTKDDCVSVKINIENDIAVLKVSPAKYDIESRFRLDPLEGSYCELEIVKIDTDALAYKILPFNASASEGNKYLFLTNDPIIEFVGDFQNVTYFDIYYRINLLTTKGVIDVTRENLNIASVKLNIFKQELHAIKSSRGYRLLERLRCIKRRYLGCI